MAATPPRSNGTPPDQHSPPWRIVSAPSPLRPVRYQLLRRVRPTSAQTAATPGLRRNLYQAHPRPPSRLLQRATHRNALDEPDSPPIPISDTLRTDLIPACNVLFCLSFSLFCLACYL